MIWKNVLTEQGGVFLMQGSFYAMLYRMRYITRWGLMKNSRNETLSEHTLDTAQITHALCLIANKRLGKNIDCGRAVLTALYHDCSEIITGDMPTPIKYFSKDLRAAYKQAESNANMRLLSLLPDDFRAEYEEYFYCDDTEIAALVKAADKLSALIKCAEENKSGNTEFKKASESTISAIKELNIPEADIFLDEIYPSYLLTLDELA